MSLAAPRRLVYGTGGPTSPERHVNPADKRLRELIDKWLTSLDLHLKYSALDEATYWKIQPWVKHDRPSRWIIELARQKAMQLKEQVDARIEMGDAKFADALELMGFLTNLVGSQHIARFIPLAEPQNEADPRLAARAAGDSAKVAIGESTRVAALTTQPRAAITASTRQMPQQVVREPPPATPAQAAQAAQAARATARAQDGTRVMPKAPAPGGGTKSVRSDTTRRSASGRRDSKAAHAARAPEPRPSDPERDNKIVEDALRLLGWGRQWHELPELISRMADRPPLSEVRRILREQKDVIETRRAPE